ncbi:MAG: tRNA lysidine(34) synthetase TilS [Kiritimatiellia bacterium]
MRVEAGALCIVAPTRSPVGTLAAPGVLDLPGGVLRATREAGHRAAGPGEAWISAARVGDEALTVRAWRPGDRYRPHRAPGRRKLQDLFADARIPRSRRAGVPVIECRGRSSGWRAAGGARLGGRGAGRTQHSSGLPLNICAEFGF